MNIPQPFYGRFTAEIEVRDERTPEQLVWEAEEYLQLYKKNRREALRADTRNKWLVHLREAIRLLDLAEAREIDVTARVQREAGL